MPLAMTARRNGPECPHTLEPTPIENLSFPMEDAGPPARIHEVSAEDKPEPCDGQGLLTLAPSDVKMKPVGYGVREGSMGQEVAVVDNVDFIELLLRYKGIAN